MDKFTVEVRVEDLVMIDKPKIQTLTLKVARSRALVWQSLGWLGSLSFLGSTVVVAQAPIEQSKPTGSANSQPVLEIVPSQVELPSVIDPALPSKAGSGNSLPPMFEIAPPEASPSATATVPLEPNGAYIDPTSYSTGATHYSAPSSIVVTERSTGCRTTLSPSALVDNLCQPQTATSPSLAMMRGNSISPVNRRSAVSFNLLNSGNVTSDEARTWGPTIPQSSYYNPFATRNALRLPARLGNNNTRLLFPLWLPAPITSWFGWRVHPVTGEFRFHSGVDLGAPLGTPVLAAYAGRVVISEFMGGYGLTVTIGHNTHLPSQQAQQQQVYSEETLYAHLAEVYVQPGDWVEQGAVIGLVGSTGLSTGPHLHFELRQATSEGWVTVDPGAELEQALALLIQSLQYAQNPPSQYAQNPPSQIASSLGFWLDTSMAGRSASTLESSNSASL
ncbi:MAG: M23 family metallopeptidase [Cyanobacteria bacterium]|nr:M23 family metallopeptidase [Cyanobacteriota bacterium]MDW8202607.1 M23 family metallopeptidase [Cyanobacteriota bacterium SKYGB_h_bin112]